MESMESVENKENIENKEVKGEPRNQGNPRNSNKKEIPINEIVELINNKKLTKKEACERWNISGKTFTRIIKDNEYIYNQTNKKYEKVGKQEDPQDLFKITYLIPKELHKALKLQAVFEGNTATEVIIKALEKYIPDQTKDLAKNYRGN